MGALGETICAPWPASLSVLGAEPLALAALGRPPALVELHQIKVLPKPGCLLTENGQGNALLPLLALNEFLKLW
jgi:hypothetical protein